MNAWHGYSKAFFSIVKEYRMDGEGHLMMMLIPSLSGMNTTGRGISSLCPLE